MIRSVKKNKVNALSHRCVALSAGILSVAVVAGVQAHHSVSATYDPTRSIEITGEVVQWRLKNPHSQLIVEGIGTIDGVRVNEEPVRWEIDSSAASIFRGMGITADTFKPGDHITVKGSPHRKEGVYRADTLARYGNFLDENLQAIGATRERNELDAEDIRTDGVRSLVGLWNPPFRQIKETPPYPLTEKGWEEWRNYDPKLSPANTCELLSIPDVFNAPGFVVTIEIAEDMRQAIVRNQAYNIVRTIPLDGTSAKAEPSGILGVVTGRIEDDVLIIESRDYPASRWGLGSAAVISGAGADVPSSEQKSIVERFSVSEDGLTLTYQYTVTDPVYLTEPYSDSITMPRLPNDTTIFPHDCDPESASQFSRE